ncbi:unnamed protein product [Mytilus coruscus]|uniref:RNase H type-1 domain-containing protein n=1 Tax=Mytilus coruscus TaxID=42192 RepID=A0A6J8BUH8_MYTCO|nr:unnamed protein product [Mytilus coruscus]
MCMTTTLLMVVKSLNVIKTRGNMYEVKSMTKDMFKMLTYGIYTANRKRKQLITPGVPHKYRRVTDVNTPVVDYLFGDNLDTRLEDLEKEDRRINKLSFNDPFFRGTEWRNVQDLHGKNHHLISNQSMQKLLDKYMNRRATKTRRWRPGFTTKTSVKLIQVKLVGVELIKLLEKKTEGFWSAEEREMHIIFLELKAAFLTLQSLAGNISQKHIRMNLDNTVAISYIENFRGKITNLHILAKEIWFWCLKHKLWISVAHIAGKLNIEADKLSRKLNDDMEWTLKTELCHRTGDPENHQGQVRQSSIDSTTLANTNMVSATITTDQPTILHSAEKQSLSTTGSETNSSSFKPPTGSFCLVQENLEKIKDFQHSLLTSYYTLGDNPQESNMGLI